MNRRGIVFAFTTGAALLASASMAVACVTFKGKMVVDGNDGDTTVVGKGNSHGYCTTGRPTTAAAGQLADSITATVSPGTCGDGGALANHQLPDKTYQVRFNNIKAYTFGGTYWTMISGAGCFNTAHTLTTKTVGSLVVTSGSGSWTGSLGTIPGTYQTQPGEAGNFCVGDGTNGMLSPYRWLL